MFKAFDLCIPTRGTPVPDGPESLHEIKYDGFRVRPTKARARLKDMDWKNRICLVDQVMKTTAHEDNSANNFGGRQFHLT